MVGETIIEYAKKNKMGLVVIVFWTLRVRPKLLGLSDYSFQYS